MNLQPTSPASQRTFLGHPIGLYVLFFTEMWERFSYYGMRALLMLYMVNYFRWSQKDASTIYKWYTSLVYLTPLIGGYLADRYLGNRRAVIIGAALMAVGHFLMAFEPLPAFMSALVFLIIGNGFFKPNMSTQVGRLYPPNDPRRDGAYTIFYMGVNLGAFLSPLACGWLAENTLGGYHSGFTLAGIGMVIGLVIYVLGQPLVQELPPLTEASASAADGAPLSEHQAEQSPSVVPTLNRLAPTALTLAGVAIALAAPVLALPGIELIAWNTAVSLEIAAVCALFSAWIVSRVQMALRDRVLAMFVLGIFVVFFWAAFEQAGNALNLWADKSTDRYLTQEAPPPSLFPPVPAEPEAAADTPAAAPSGLERWTSLFKPKPGAASDAAASGGLEESWTGLWNPVPTAWFQSINALAIFVLAPLFAALWTFLGRRNWNPSVPTKMALGVLLVGLGFALMVVAAERENQPSSTRLLADKLPEAIQLTPNHQLASRHEESGALELYHAGRLIFDPAGHVLQMTGVLTDLERDRMIGDTAPAAFVARIEELQKKTQQARAQGQPFAVSVQLDQEPPGLDMRYAGFAPSQVRYDAATRTLTATIELADKDLKALRVAAGDPHFRDTLNELMVQSARYKVSSWWLFWFYILITIGELCLSPVGLSMVSKLAPARFATMLMGLWLLTSFFGNFVAGAFGEIWGTVAPTPFFWIFVAALTGAAVVLFLLVRKVVGMMHGVN